MKISLNWINDYVELRGINIEELIKKIGLSTAEIEGVEYKGKNVSGVIVGQILEVNEHPRSNHLHKLKVNTGKEVLDIVCGAPNVKVGLKVALATLGGEVGDMKMEKAIIAGEESYGMCCSKDELGFSENEEGIWELPDNLELGKNIKELYPLDDVVIEIDNKSLTNRPDLWGHYGLAREISAITGRPLKPLITENLQYYNQSQQLDIVVDAENCYRYSGIRIGNIKEKFSPIEMQIRLFYCGMRAINLLADLTNYLMLEMGQPMHAFDGELVNNIQVKELTSPIEFATLDKEIRTIPAKSIMIYSSNEPVAVAGVMGGLNSEIRENTTQVLLESANFDATCVRKTAANIGLRSEASARYEKSLDPEMTVLALSRFVHILRQIDRDIIIKSALTDIYKKRMPQRTINTSLEFIQKYMGVKISLEQVVDILQSLGFIIDCNGTNMFIKVPSYRATKDVTIAVDIVEEVARMYGYDKIEKKAVTSELKPVEQKTEHILEYDTKLMLAEKFGLNETHSYIWNDVKANKDLNLQTKGFVKVLNSTVKDNDEIRSELVPTLLKVLLDNRKQQKEVNTFEVGRIVSGLDSENLCIEEKHLAIVLSSTEKTDKQLYFGIKQIVETLTSSLLNRSVELKIGETDINYVHPVNNASIYINGGKVGYIGLLHPRVKQNLEKWNAAILEIDFDKFSNQKAEAIKVKEQSKFQTVSLDFNFVINETEVYADVYNYLKSYKTTDDISYELKFVDLYTDKNIWLDKKSITFNCVLSCSTHTLTGDEIESFHSGMIKYAENNGYELRLI